MFCTACFEIFPVHSELLFLLYFFQYKPVIRNLIPNLSNITLKSLEKLQLQRLHIILLPVLLPVNCQTVTRWFRIKYFKLDVFLLTKIKFESFVQLYLGPAPFDNLCSYITYTIPFYNYTMYLASMLISWFWGNGLIAVIYRGINVN